MKRWEPWEVEYLVKTWPTDTTIAAMSEYLGRPAGGICMKAHHLRKQDYTLRRHPRSTDWTERQRRVLRQYWDREPHEHTAARTGRSVRACSLKAAEYFGSERRERWEQEDREVA